MGLIGGNLWDDIVDPYDKKKKRQDWGTAPKKGNKSSPDEPHEPKVSGLMIFYRTLGCIILLATMIKSWFAGTTVVDWVLIFTALLLIGIHRRFGAEYAVDRIKPVFINLHNRLVVLESKENTEVDPDDIKDH